VRGCLVIVDNQAYYCCVVGLDDSVGGVRGHTVICKQGVQERAELRISEVEVLFPAFTT
jgi:hypothetical protein